MANLCSSNLRWNYAFGFAAIVMTISLITFIYTKRTLGAYWFATCVYHRKQQQKMVRVCCVFWLSCHNPYHHCNGFKTQYTDYFMYTIGPLTLMYLIYELIKLNSSERKKMYAAIAFVIQALLITL